MTEPGTTTDTPNGEELKTISSELVELLRLRTLPFGMKLFEDADEMLAIKGIRTPTKDRHFTMCQMVTPVRISGHTLGVVHENLQLNGNCGGVVGLNAPSDHFMSGEKMDGVWFSNREASREHQEQMVRVPHGTYNGVAASPLRTGRLDPPDICLFYATPGQMIIFINGLQHNTYKKYEFSVTGETACSDSWGRALATRETSLSIPCFAERRFGGVADDELLMALPPDELKRGVEGMKGLHKNGLRYPISPYSVMADPAEGMGQSYG